MDFQSISFQFIEPNDPKTRLFPRNSSSYSLSLYTPKLLVFRHHLFPSSFPLASNSSPKQHNNKLLCNCSSTPIVSPNATHYEDMLTDMGTVPVNVSRGIFNFRHPKIVEGHFQLIFGEFNDDSSEVELRLELGDESINPGDIFVDTNENSLVITVQKSEHIKTFLDTNSLYGMIKPSETIWYIDDAQLVVNLKKQDRELKWPDIMESWESLTLGLVELLKGTSVFLVGESTEINHKVARELAVGLRYTPLCAKKLLEAYTKQTIDAWVRKEGSDAVAEAECAILESLSSRARTVVATLGGKHGAASKWQHLFAGLTVWLSHSESNDERSAKEEAMEDGVKGYTNPEAVVKLAGRSPAYYSQNVAQASLSALKRLVLSDKNLAGRKSLYVRLGCRGDWPDIKPPPGWDPSSSGTGQGRPVKLWGPVPI